jgi:hypothetical protein
MPPTDKPIRTLEEFWNEFQKWCFEQLPNLDPAHVERAKGLFYSGADRAFRIACQCAERDERELFMSQVEKAKEFIKNATDKLKTAIAPTVVPKAIGPLPYTPKIKSPGGRKSLDAEWHEYMTQCYGNVPMGEERYRQLKRAFYGGAWVTFGMSIVSDGCEYNPKERADFFVEQAKACEAWIELECKRLTAPLN